MKSSQRFIIQDQIQSAVQQESLIKDKNEENQKQNQETSSKSQDELDQKLSPKGLIGTESENVGRAATSRRLTGPSQFDSRIELRLLDPTIDQEWLILQRSKSVGIVLEKRLLHRLTDSIYQIDISTTLGDLYRLCSKEPFQEQPAVGAGTAFVIDTTEMVTARHVLTKSLANYAIVFGFELSTTSGLVETVIHARDIYFPQSILKSYSNYDVVRLSVDRPINRPKLLWKNSAELSVDSDVYMIGHPTGLPKKVAINAGISENGHPQYFYTTLDSFQGNSGSPVFDFRTHKVIGILVSGELDYFYNGSCYESTLCTIPYCKGEKVIRIEQILNK